MFSVAAFFHFCSSTSGVSTLRSILKNKNDLIQLIEFISVKSGNFCLKIETFSKSSCIRLQKQAYFWVVA